MKYDMNLWGNQLAMLCLYTVVPTACVGLIIKWLGIGGKDAK